MHAPQWDQLLDDFEDLVEQVGHAVDLDHWVERDLPTVARDRPAGPPTDDQVTRLRQLLLEADRLGDQIRSQQAGVRADLARTRAEGMAGRAYLHPTP
jgi:hypothetical protein